MKPIHKLFGLVAVCAWALLVMAASGPPSGGTGGGGTATNAIENLNGNGTNTTLKGTTTISNLSGQKANFSSNVTVSGNATFNSNVTINGSAPMLFSPFTPADVADLALWLDATTNTYTQGQQVTQWLGRVSSATNAAGPYFQTNAINGKPAMRFFGTNRLDTLATFASSENTNFTFFAVVRTTNAAINPYAAYASINGAAWFATVQTATGFQAEAPGFSSTGFSPSAGVLAYKLPWGVTTNSSFISTFSYNGSFVVRGVNWEEEESALTGNLGLSGAMALGQLTGGTSAYTGDIAEVLAYKRYLTITERHAVLDYLRRKWNPGVASKIIFAGNSLTAGTGAGAGLDYVSQVTNSFGTNVLVVNSGVASKTTSAFFADAATLDAGYLSERPDNLLVFWEITNELYYGTNVVDAYRNYVVFCAGRQAAGHKVIATTVLPRLDGGTPVTHEADRLLINGLIRTNWPTFATALWDPAAISTINTTNSCTNTVYYADLVHLTPYGYSILANDLKKVIRKVASTNVWAK